MSFLLTAVIIFQLFCIPVLHLFAKICISYKLKGASFSFMEQRTFHLKHQGEYWFVKEFSH